MEAKELRIGNYVYDSTDHCQIDVKCSDLCYSGNFEPIPLTEEWLIKCEDFKEYEFLKNRKFYKYGNLIVELIPDNRLAVYWSNEILCFLDYVHELQNFVHATFQEELTISNK